MGALRFSAIPVLSTSALLTVGCGDDDDPPGDAATTTQGENHSGRIGEARTSARSTLRALQSAGLEKLGAEGVA